MYKTSEFLRSTDFPQLCSSWSCWSLPQLLRRKEALCAQRNFPLTLAARTLAPATTAKNRAVSNGDLDNTDAIRASKRIDIDQAFNCCCLAAGPDVDDKEVQERYRPFILDTAVESTDWISHLELSTATKLVLENLLRTGEPLRVLVLYGSLQAGKTVFWLKFVLFY